MMSDFEGIKGLIKLKESEIKNRTKKGIHEHKNFKRLLAACSNYKNERPLSGIISILISEVDILNSQNANSKNLYDSIDKCVKGACNHLKINADYELIDLDKVQYSDTNELREVYRELSKEEFCVIVINPISTTYFIQGDEVGKAIFFTKMDLERFEQRKEITELRSLLEDYRTYIQQRWVYQNFFVSKSGKCSLFKHLIADGKIPKPANNSLYEKEEKKFLKLHSNLLENKPEDRFRENLRKFLDDKLKGTVTISKEHILESFKRIDIFINDEFGELYLIEVKWIGKSIHGSGTDFGHEVTPANLINPSAINQTINYLAELHKYKKDIKFGYLVVFDGRYENHQADSIQSFDPTTLDDSIKQFYHRFEKIKDFRVINFNPN